MILRVSGETKKDLKKLWKEKFRSIYNPKFGDDCISASVSNMMFFIGFRDVFHLALFTIFLLVSSVVRSIYVTNFHKYQTNFALRNFSDTRLEVRSLLDCSTKCSLTRGCLGFQFVRELRNTSESKFCDVLNAGSLFYNVNMFSPGFSVYLSHGGVQLFEGLNSSTQAEQTTRDPVMTTTGQSTLVPVITTERSTTDAVTTTEQTTDPVMTTEQSTTLSSITTTEQSTTLSFITTTVPVTTTEQTTTEQSTTDPVTTTEQTTTDQVTTTEQTTTDQVTTTEQTTTDPVTTTEQTTTVPVTTTEQTTTEQSTTDPVTSTEQTTTDQVTTTEQTTTDRVTTTTEQTTTDPVTTTTEQPTTEQSTTVPVTTTKEQTTTVPFITTQQTTIVPVTTTTEKTTTVPVITTEQMTTVTTTIQQTTSVSITAVDAAAQLPDKLLLFSGSYVMEFSDYTALTTGPCSRQLIDTVFSGVAGPVEAAYTDTSMDNLYIVQGTSRYAFSVSTGNLTQSRLSRTHLVPQR
ncbi:hypothetical protein ScPMuIL_017715 [Solemya velum]